MSSDALDELLDRAKFGRLSSMEVNHVAARISPAREEGDADLYTLLHILGRASNAEAHAEVVAPFVGHRHDPMVASLALKIMCRWWGAHR